MHIRDEAEYLQRVSSSLNQAAFLSDETIRRAFVRSLEIIGEATKNIPSEIRNLYPDIEWRSMAGMRDRLIHDYIAVDYELVWDVVQEKIPDLLARTERIIRENS